MTYSRQLFWLIGSVVLLLPITSTADTITLLDGTSYNGLVTYSNGKFKVRTQIKDGVFTRFVAREDVWLVEFNSLRTNPLAPPPELANFGGDKCDSLAAQSATAKASNPWIGKWCVKSPSNTSQIDAEVAKIKDSLPPGNYSVDITKTADSNDKAAMMKYADEKRELGQIFDVPENQVHMMSATGDIACDKCTYIQVARVHAPLQKGSGRYIFTLISTKTFRGALSTISENSINCIDSSNGTNKKIDRSQVSRISVQN